MVAPSATWTYLAASPLTWTMATLLAYGCAFSLYRKTGFHPAAHPVALSVAILVAVLSGTGTPYPDYFNGTQLIHFLLGPATVALALPLYQQVKIIRRDWLAVIAGTLVGGAAAIVTGMGVASALGASRVTVLSFASKSVTMPIAMSITEKIGGLTSLTSALVMLTGVLGAAVTERTLAALHITDNRTIGFSLGVSAHGIGTARAFQLGQQAGAFSGIAMGLSGLLTGLLLPYFLKGV